jgi:hypothetical protein
VNLVKSLFFGSKADNSQIAIMSNLWFFYPYEEIFLQTRFTHPEIMNRMHWLFTQSSGIPGTDGIRGYMTGPNTFILESGLQEYGGVVGDNQVKIIVRMKRGPLLTLLIVSGILVLASLVAILSRPRHWDDNIVVPIVTLAVYFGLMMRMRYKTGIISTYLLQLLEAQRMMY